MSAEHSTLPPKQNQPAFAASPHLRRRLGGAFAMQLAAPFLELVLAFFRWRSAIGESPENQGKITVFQAYMVGDLFLALPALRRLQAAYAPGQVQVLCRPDCVALLRERGFEALPLAHPWFMANTPRAFWASFRAALAYRGHLGVTALDTDADPRTGFLLQLMGVREVLSYRRPQARFFHRLFELPGAPQHQSEKNEAVVEGFLREKKILERRPLENKSRIEQQDGKKVLPRLWISAWTRKSTKNWPLEKWEKVLELLSAQGVAFSLLDPPDGDAAWQAFASRWPERLLRLPLTQLDRALRGADGVTAVMTLDNFLGHMAADAGQPVLWINGSSSPEQVAPRGPAGQATQIVQIEVMPCRPCGHRCTEKREAHCLTDLEVAVVWPKIEAWLKGLGFSIPPAPSSLQVMPT